MYQKESGRKDPALKTKEIVNQKKSKQIARKSIDGIETSQKKRI